MSYLLHLTFLAKWWVKPYRVESHYIFCLDSYSAVTIERHPMCSISHVDGGRTDIRGIFLMLYASPVSAGDRTDTSSDPFIILMGQLARIIPLVSVVTLWPNFEQKSSIRLAFLVSWRLLSPLYCVVSAGDTFNPFTVKHDYSRLKPVLLAE